jgi:hypothetical protein
MRQTAIQARQCPQGRGPQLGACEHEKGGVLRRIRFSSALPNSSLRVRH